MSLTSDKADAEIIARGNVNELVGIIQRVERERDARPPLSNEAVDDLVRRVVESSRSTMRRVIGDRTVQQYDRADQMAEGIALAVRHALAELKLTKEEQ